MSANETVYLHYINQLSFDAEAEIFRDYPGFKLGVTRCVRHYAELLLPVVKQLMANEPEHDRWMLTAPALAADTPSGANLLCWELFDLHRGDPQKLFLSDIRYENEAMASIDYAKLDFADRLTERERLSRRLMPNADFQGRPVLFVNDICVTGAQQQTMQEYFDRVGAVCVKWLYLIFVDPEVGKAKPQIEWEINSTPFEELVRLVSSDEIRFTGKCVQRLTHLSVPELDRVLAALSTERREQLLAVASRNGIQLATD